MFMAQRSEVLHIVLETTQTKASKARPVPLMQTVFKCDPAYELMLKEVLHYHRPSVSSIVVYHADPATKILPGKMFQLFDWVICKFIPKNYWGAGGIVNCRTHLTLPDVVGNRKDVYFFAGFYATLPRLVHLATIPVQPIDQNTATPSLEQSTATSTTLPSTTALGSTVPVSNAEPFMEDVVIVTAQPEEELKFKFEVISHFNFNDKKNV